jgi:hypothetical protein
VGRALLSTFFDWIQSGRECPLYTDRTDEICPRTNTFT